MKAALHGVFQDTFQCCPAIDQQIFVTQRQDFGVFQPVCIGCKARLDIRQRFADLAAMQPGGRSI